VSQGVQLFSILSLKFSQNATAHNFIPCHISLTLSTTSTSNVFGAGFDQFANVTVKFALGSSIIIFFSFMLDFFDCIS